MSFKLTKNNYFYEFCFYDKRRYTNRKETETEIKERERDYIREKSAFAKRKIIEYGLSNKWTHFITITTDARKIDRDNSQLIISRIKKYFNNYKNRIDANFRYIIVPELHKDGRVHFHGLIYTEKSGQFKYMFTDKRTKNAVYRNEWLYMHLGANRFVKIRKNTEYCIFYMLKYISKQMNFPFSHRYYCSKGLKTPECKYNNLDYTVEEGYYYGKINELGLVPSYENNFVEKYKMSHKEFEMIFGAPMSKILFRNLLADDRTVVEFTEQLFFDGFESTKKFKAKRKVRPLPPYKYMYFVTSK